VIATWPYQEPRSDEAVSFVRSNQYGEKDALSLHQGHCNLAKTLAEHP
jgi:hypothetical protein